MGMDSGVWLRPLLRVEFDKAVFFSAALQVPFRRELFSAFLATCDSVCRLGMRLPRPCVPLDGGLDCLALGELLAEVEEDVCTDSGGVGDGAELDAVELVPVAVLEPWSVLSHSLAGFSLMLGTLAAVAVELLAAAFSDGSRRRSKKEMMLKEPFGDSLLSPLNLERPEV